MDGLNHSVITGECSGCVAYREKVARLEAANAALAAAGQKLREELAEVGAHTDMIWDGALLREWDAALSDADKGKRCPNCRGTGTYDDETCTYCDGSAVDPCPDTGEGWLPPEVE